MNFSCSAAEASPANILVANSKKVLLSIVSVLTGFQGHDNFFCPYLPLVVVKFLLTVGCGYVMYEISLGEEEGG